MPYIEQKLRDLVDDCINEITYRVKYFAKDTKNGVVTYILYKIVKDLYKNSFDEISDGVKVLECAKNEFIRQVLNPYEDQKIKKNGGV